MNNNGLRETGEAGIPGVELILLDADGNPTGDTGMTDAEGHYCFPGLHPGVYGITEIQPDGYHDGLDTPGTLGGVAHNPGDLIDLIPLGSGQTGKEYNFGERLLVGISGYVYADDDNDGVKDSGEAGIAGVTLTLLDAEGNATGTTTVTDADGYYRFENLPPGTYGVAEAQPSGYYDGLDTPGNAGGAAHNPGDSITGAVLDGGIVAVNYNFGELRPGEHSRQRLRRPRRRPDSRRGRKADRRRDRLSARRLRQADRLDPDQRQRRIPVHQPRRRARTASRRSSRPSISTATSGRARPAASWRRTT